MELKTSLPALLAAGRSRWGPPACSSCACPAPAPARPARAGGRPGARAPLRGDGARCTPASCSAPALEAWLARRSRCPALTRHRPGWCWPARPPCGCGSSPPWARTGTCRSWTRPALGVVTGGPFRFIRHPNYLAVFLELLALPLVYGAWITAALGSAAHVWVLYHRIRIEEAALLAHADYRAAMGGKPRFLPAAAPGHAGAGSPAADAPVTDVDVIVVGGGLAGSSLAILLGRAGRGGRALRAARLPPGQGLRRGADAGRAWRCWRALGLLDRAGGARFRGIRYRGFGRCLQADFPDRPTASPALGLAATPAAPRRRPVRDRPGHRPTSWPTRAAGSTARWSSAGGSQGVRVEGQTRRAALVVAADGPRSRPAAPARARGPRPRRRPAWACARTTGWRRPGRVGPTSTWRSTWARATRST